MVGRMSSREAWHVMMTSVGDIPPHLGADLGPLGPGVVRRADKQRLVCARSVQVGPS